MLEFTKQDVELQPVFYGIEADKGTHHFAAVLHEVEGNDGYDKKLNDRTGNGKNGFEEIADAFDAVVAYTREGIVDDALYLIRYVELGLLIFELCKDGHCLFPKAVEVDSQQIRLHDERL